MLRSLTPNLVVDDVSATVDYYEDVLGFEFTLGVAEGTEDAVFERSGRPLGFAMLRNGDVEVMLQSRAGLAVDLPVARTGPMDSDGVLLYIDVEDIDGYRQQVGERGAEIVVELRETFYGAREFAIRDRDGFLLVFAKRPQRAS